MRHSNIDSRKIVRYTLLIFALLCFLRLFQLKADPPAYISASGGYWADEGYWTHNARNMALFGKGVLDDWNNMYVSPLLHLLSVISFSIFGISLVSARLVPVGCALLMLGMLWWSYRRDNRSDEGMLVLLFLGIQFPFLVYNRTAIVETPATFFAVVGFIFLRRSGFFASVMAGACIAASFISKTTFIFLIPLLFLSIIGPSFVGPVIADKRGVNVTTGVSEVLLRRQLTAASVGLAIPLLLWYFLIRLPHADLLAQYNAYYRDMLLPQTLSGFVKELITQRFHLYFNRTPLLLLLSHAGLFLLALGWWRKSILLKREDLFLVLWLGGGILFFGLFHYRPLRYYVPLIPPIAFLAARTLCLLITNREKIRDMFFNSTGEINPYLWGGFLLWMSYPLLANSLLGLDWLFKYSLLRLFFKRWPVLGIWYPGVLLVLLLGLSFLWWFTHHVLTGKPCFSGKYGTYVELIILLFLVVQGGQLIGWLGRPTFEVFTINQELRNFPAKGSFTGQWAGELCLETTHRVVPVFKGYLNDRRPFKKYNIRYLLVWREYNHRAHYYTHFPEAMKGSSLLRTYWIKESVVYFIALRPPR